MTSLETYIRVDNGIVSNVQVVAETPPQIDGETWLPIFIEELDFGPDLELTGDHKDEVQGARVVRRRVVAPRVFTVQDVKDEAQRRIIAITGATDLQSSMTKQLNALMRSTELVEKKASGEALTEDEVAEEARLKGMAAAIKRIRAASNVLEATVPVPWDFASDRHWI